MPKRIYLIRHGETEGNAAGRFVGTMDMPLSARGTRQVRRLGELLRPDLSALGAEPYCLASPLTRAQQTATAVAGPLGLTVSTDADLREIDFGAWEGLTAEEIEKQSPGALAIWESPTDETAFPGGESLRDFDRRVARALERILAEPAETVVVFAHGGVVRALVCGLLGLGREGFWLFAVPPATVARVEVHEDQGILSELWAADDGEGD